MRSFGWRWFRKRRRHKGVSGHGVEKPGRDASNSLEWLETRNFLYYDGKEMPAVKEDKYGKNR